MSHSSSQLPIPDLISRCEEIVSSANPIDFSREHGGSDSLTLLDQNSRVARSFCVKSLLLFLV
jgi:hypothetical protein